MDYLKLILTTGLGAKATMGLFESWTIYRKIKFHHNNPNSSASEAYDLIPVFMDCFMRASIESLIFSLLLALFYG